MSVAAGVTSSKEEVKRPRPRRPRGVLEQAWPFLSLAVIVVLLTLVLGNASGEIITYLIQALVTMIVTIGLYVFVGNSGVLSLGHAGLMAVGAYVGGIMSIPVIQKSTLLPALPHFLSSTALSLWPAALLAAVVAGVIGYLVSIPISRLSGLGAAVATLALLQISQVVLINWHVLSSDGGATPGVPVDTTTWAAVIGVVIALAIAYLYQRSASGIRLRASREDPVAARSLGINIPRERRRAFTISAAVAGLGGALYAHSVGTVSAADFFIATGFLQLAMLVVGGINSLAGAVSGVLAISLITDFFVQLENGQGVGPLKVNLPNGIETTIVSVLLLLILIKRPAGLTKGQEFRLPKRLGGRRALADAELEVPAISSTDVAVATPTDDSGVA
jgi:branched-chain amino acid transport system permease protein